MAEADPGLPETTARPSNRAGRYWVLRSSSCSLSEICGRTSNKITRWPSHDHDATLNIEELTHHVSGRNSRCRSIDANSRGRILLLRSICPGPGPLAGLRVLKGSTGIQDRCPQLTGSDSSNQKGAGCEPNC